MARNRPEVYGGVDTHGRTHHAAAISRAGEVIADREFAATPTGYRQLIGWLRQLGDVIKVGVEGTGSYGAGLARALTGEQIAVVEVDRPDQHVAVAPSR
ncbi:IS110 family transposase [Actinopolymorpha pittospori]|uniref:IS110 family transposase n=1 Tax=Actinopolymorpha pittospori TaxID=648752 RepID=UPI0017893F26|nr:transposase [Actinopolymorpha pittospori]